MLSHNNHDESREKIINDYFSLIKETRIQEALFFLNSNENYDGHIELNEQKLLIADFTGQNGVGYALTPVLEIIYASQYVTSILSEVLLLNNHISANYTQRNSEIEIQFIRRKGNIYEKLYIFWDRIGDLLNSFFKVRSQRDEDFVRIIDALEKKNIYANCANFNWLLTFKNKEYVKINNENRKLLVHYTTTEMMLQNSQINNYIQLNEEMLFLKQQHTNMIEGFKHTIKFIGKNHHLG